MIRKLVVNGQPVEVEAAADGTILLDKQQRSVSMVEVEPGIWSLLVDGRSYEVIAADGAWVVDGETVAIEVLDPRALRRQGAGLSHSGQQILKAAMPGKVVRVLVSPGDQVEAGQGIVVVEAMKMQNEVKSVQAGRVASVAVSPGAAVAAGTVLAIIE